MCVYSRSYKHVHHDISFNIIIKRTQRHKCHRRSFTRSVQISNSKKTAGLSKTFSAGEFVGQLHQRTRGRIYWLSISGITNISNSSPSCCSIGFRIPALVGVDNSIFTSSLSAAFNISIRKRALKAIAMFSPSYWHFIRSFPSKEKSTSCAANCSSLPEIFKATWLVLLLLKTLTRRNAL